jgi:hypothetical protein
VTLGVGLDSSAMAHYKRTPFFIGGLPYSRPIDCRFTLWALLVAFSLVGATDHIWAQRDRRREESIKNSRPRSEGGHTLDFLNQAFR